MRPIAFDIVDGETRFRYSTSTLKTWLKAGREHGDVGMILVSRNGNFLRYVGYGTIEVPRTVRYQLTTCHYEPFAGPMPSDEERCREPKSDPNMSYKCMMLDLSSKPVSGQL